MRDLKIPNSRTVNITDFRRTVRRLGITENIQSLTSCTACHFLMKEIRDRTLTVEVTGKAICDIYFLLQTWKISTFCEDIIQLHLVRHCFTTNNYSLIWRKINSFTIVNMVDVPHHHATKNLIEIREDH